VNLALDQVLRSLIEDADFRRRAGTQPEQAAKETGIAVSDLATALAGDVVALYERGAQPLLIMAIGQAAGVDPMPAFEAVRRKGAWPQVDHCDCRPVRPPGPRG
jgi:hypothetical protein